MKTVSQVRKGFTLVELVLAMVIMGLLMASIFKLADATVRSTRGMVDHQSEEITRDALFTMMRRHFEELPGNCRVDLKLLTDREPFLSELTFQNAPVSFNWGGVSLSAEAMRIVTVKDLDGLDVVLEYYNQPILDTDESLAELGIEPIASVILLEGVSDFEWYMLDGSQLPAEDEEWPWEWEKTRLPTLIKLRVKYSAGGEFVRRIFWCPTKINPRSYMNNLQSRARSNRGGGAGGAVPTPNPGGGNPTGGNGGDAPVVTPRPSPGGPSTGGGGAGR